MNDVSRLRIAASKAPASGNYTHYEPWLQRANDSVELVDLWSCANVEEAVTLLSSCHGLLLTGGPDVDPERYGQPEKRELCADIDPHRDELELALIEAAGAAMMPTLGICRGLQILNVALGGTLIADIPTHNPHGLEHRRLEGVDATHDVEADGGSLIHRICRTIDGTVNSAHHQGIERLAPALTAASHSTDGIIEAIEWGDAALGGKPFLLGVQWHPERMPFDSPMSGRIAMHFATEVELYAILNSKNAPLR
jgi:putative glutamine amidotransferase